MRSFEASALISDRIEKPKWTLIRIKRETPKVDDRQFEMEKYCSTSYEMGGALEQDPERCTASRCKAVLDSRLGNIRALLQLCRQHPAARKL